MSSLKQLPHGERVLSLYAAILAAASVCASLYLFRKGEPYTAAWLAFALSFAFILIALPGIDSRWSGAYRRAISSFSVTLSRENLLALILLSVVVVLALSIRLFNISNLPAGVWYDEAINLWDARHISENVSSTPVFVRVNPVFYLLPTAGLIHVFGAIPETVRLVSVGFSIAGIVATFLLARHFMGQIGATLPALILALTRWDISFSRVGMIPITVPFLAALVAFLTIRAIKSRRNSDFGFAGVAMGLGVWFYSGFFAFSIVVGFMLLHYLLVQRPSIKEWAKQCALTVSVAAVVASPLIQFAVTDSETFFARAEATSIFTNESAAPVVEDLVRNVRSHLSMFHLKGDGNPRHNLPGLPMLDLMSGGLLLVGIFVAIWRWRKLPYAVLPIWLLAMLLPGILTHESEAPQALRSIGVLPAVAILVALPLVELWNLGLQQREIWLRQLTVIAVLVSIASIGFINVDTYFGKQARDPRVFAAFSTDGTLMGKHMAERQSQGFVLMASPHYEYSLQIDFAGNNPDYRVIRVPEDVPIDSLGVSRGVSIFIDPRESSLFRLLETYYPEAHFETVRPPGGGEPLYLFAEMKREHLASKQGLTAEYRYRTGEVIQGVVETTQVVWQIDRLVREDLGEFAWRGSILFTQQGEYAFRLIDDNSTTVYLDGRKILDSGTRQSTARPAVGLHYLEIKGTVFNPSTSTSVLWKPPDGEFHVIPFGSLYHGSVSPFGLVGVFRGQGTESSSSEVASQVTPSVNNYWHAPVVPLPYTATWSGSIEVEVSGDYNFYQTANGELGLWIDGELIAETTRDGEGVESEVALSAGSHQIRIDYKATELPSQFNLLWRPPFSDVLVNLPIDQLVPDNGGMLIRHNE